MSLRGLVSGREEVLSVGPGKHAKLGSGKSESLRKKQDCERGCEGAAR